MLWGLLILGACAGDEHRKMLAHLEELERQNLADSVMANDSLAERLAVYFDQHGTTNERMRAHYTSDAHTLTSARHLRHLTNITSLPTVPTPPLQTATIGY